MQASALSRAASPRVANTNFSCNFSTLLLVVLAPVHTLAWPSFWWPFSSPAQVQEVAYPPSVTVPLRKQYVPVSRNGTVVAYKTSYFGDIAVGNPSQAFTVVFDTGSGHLILPSLGCRSETCKKHRRFNRRASTTSQDIEHDGTRIPATATSRDQVSISFGTGQVVGEFVEDEACIGVAAPSLADQGAATVAQGSSLETEKTATIGKESPPDAREATPAMTNAASEPEGLPNHMPTQTSVTLCTSLRVVLANNMSAEPFGLFEFDGVLGLGLAALTLNERFSFFGQMAEQQVNMKPMFSVFIARNEEVGQSFITFGGYESELATSDVEWAPVAREDLGYWQVQIKSVRVGETVLEDCADGECRAVLDTGTSLLGVPRQSSRTLHHLLARPVPEELLNEGGSAQSVDCRGVAGVDLVFELERGLLVTMSPEDYRRPAPVNVTVQNTSRAFCRSLLLPLDIKAPLGPKIFIWGEPMLRKYYTIYDWRTKHVGFASARQPSLATGHPSTEVGDTRSRLPLAAALVPGAPLVSPTSPATGTQPPPPAS